MPLSFGFALLNAQVRIVIAIASDGLSNFHPSAVCATVVFCCVVELVYMRWDPPHQHVPVNLVRETAIAIALWCGVCGLAACWQDDSHKWTSACALVV
eukprot:COSAG05_NODE_15911_length_358_cov_0.787645_1_plen_97_part_10